jgi:hypothetical protein
MGLHVRVSHMQCNYASSLHFPVALIKYHYLTANLIPTPTRPYVDNCFPSRSKLTHHICCLMWGLQRFWAVPVAVFGLCFAFVTRGAVGPLYGNLCSGFFVWKKLACRSWHCKIKQEKSFLYLKIYISTILTNLIVIQFKFENKRGSHILICLNQNSNNISLIFESYHLWFISLEI